MQNITTLLASIPPTESDKLLLSWGYNLAVEYLEILNHASLDSNQPILELATGTGRMSAILARLGYDVLSGDISTSDREKAVSKHDKKSFLLNFSKLLNLFL